jgi:membrane protein YdbS with pleckstrin-like domain/phage FluMu protein Com
MIDRPSETRAAMQIECDACEKVFDAPAEKAGGKMPCPHCGDINRVPEADSPEVKGLPPETGPEITITTVRPAMFRAHPFRYIFIVLLFLIGVGVAIIAPTYDNWSNRFAIPGIILTLLAMIWWLWWWLTTTMWIKLTLTNKRAIRCEGIIHRHTSEVLHDHVRNVTIRQSFLDRIMRVGYLGIASAGQGGIEIEIRDIPHPHRIKSIVDEYRKM